MEEIETVIPRIKQLGEQGKLDDLIKYLIGDDDYEQDFTAFQNFIEEGNRENQSHIRH